MILFRSKYLFIFKNLFFFQCEKASSSLRSVLFLYFEMKPEPSEFFWGSGVSKTQDYVRSKPRITSSPCHSLRGPEHQAPGAARDGPLVLPAHKPIFLTSLEFPCEIQKDFPGREPWPDSWLSGGSKLKFVVTSKKLIYWAWNLIAQ